MTARKPGHSLSSAKKGSAPTQSSRRAGKPIEAAIAEFLLDRESQNHSPKTLTWHRTALAHLAAFLEEHYRLSVTLSVFACLQPLSLSKGLFKKGDCLSNNSSGRVQRRPYRFRTSLKSGRS
jgi:hypothetical protein